MVVGKSREGFFRLRGHRIDTPWKRCKEAGTSDR